MRSKLNSATLVCLLFLFGIGKTFAQPIASAGVNLTLCPGATAIIGGTPTASGGVGSYTYQWSPAVGISSVSVPNPVITAFGLVTYTVTVTDANSATATASVTISLAPTPNVSFNIPAVLTCTAHSEVLTASSTTTGATFNWGAGITGASKSVSEPGIYDVTVTDPSSGCSVVAEDTVTSDATIPSVSITITGPINGCANTGAVDTLTALPVNGVPGYTFSWSGSYLNTPHTQTVQVNPNLAGTYTYVVTVTDSHNCTGTNSLAITLTNCGTLIANAGNDTTVCQGSAALLGGHPTAQGGTQPYTYAWNSGAAPISNPALSPAANTRYTLTVTDANGVTATASILVNVSSCLGTLTVSAGINTTVCRGNTIPLEATVDGGSPPYAYAWSPGGGLVNPTSQAAFAIPITTTTYTITVTDNNSNSATSSVVITVNPSPRIDSLVANSQTCQDNNGIVTSYVSGGTPGYLYSWSNNALGNSFINGLSPGTYVLTVSDTRSCSASASVVVTDPLAVNIDSIVTTNVSCFGGSNGSICVFASGGGPFVYSWSNGATLNPCIPQLVAGTYVLTVTNATGCSVSTSATITQPPAISLSQTTTNGTCLGVQDGSIIVTATGGTPPFNYSINGGPFQQSNTFALVMPGAYVVTAADSLGCSDTIHATIQANYSVTGSVSNKSDTWCYNTPGDTITASIFGGTSPFTYSLNGITFQSSGVFSVNTPNIYVVTIKDQHGCTVFVPDTIRPRSPQINDQIGTTNVTCNGANNGSSCLTVSGGTIPFTFQWSNFTTTQCINGLSAGSFYVIITDALGCGIVDSAIVAQPAPLVIDSFSSSTACGVNNGTLTVHPSGGTPTYVYAWSQTGTTQTITGLTANTYCLTVVDVNGCTAGGCGQVAATGGITIDSMVTTNVACYATNSGSACVYASGGPGITYMWSPMAATTPCVTSLSSGAYQVIATNSSGCSISASAVITQPTQLVDSVVQYLTGCTVASYAMGGTPPYNYLWSSGQTGSIVLLSYPAVYIETVTDANNCWAFDTIQMGQNNPLHLQVLEPDSNSVPDTVSIIIHGGILPYYVNWNNTTFDSLPDSTGTHIYNLSSNSNIVVVDSEGCATYFQVDLGCTDQCVWPGDANYDGVVDNNDLLAIGLGYDDIGYARLNATINFIPQFCTNWYDTLLAGINYKHVDCNGDGVINATDTNAIVLNYDRTHPRNGTDQPWKINSPVLHVTVSPDTLVDGQTAVATLSLGDSAMPCTNVYALAFTYNFDPLVVDSNSVNISFGNSWLAGTGDHISISKTFYDAGQVQAALTRIDHGNRSGQGPIATVSMKITTGNINGKDLSYYIMNNFITRLTVINDTGHVLSINEGSDSAVVAFSPTDVKPIIKDLHIQIFPNPANDVLNIKSTLTQIQDISIVDLTGQQVLALCPETGTSISLNIADLSAGVYTINIKANNQHYHTRFVKVNAK